MTTRRIKPELDEDDSDADYLPQLDEPEAKPVKRTTTYGISDSRSFLQSHVRGVLTRHGGLNADAVDAIAAAVADAIDRNNSDLDRNIKEIARDEAKHEARRAR